MDYKNIQTVGVDKLKCALKQRAYYDIGDKVVN